jgi:sugar lactone lactonase YvrE
MRAGFSTLTFLLLVFALPAVRGQVITTIAGTAWSFPNTPIPALNAPLGNPVSIVVDAKGSLYVADSANHMVFKVSPDGALTVVAGNGVAADSCNIFSGKCPLSGEGEPATSASLSSPAGVAASPDGAVYFGDSGSSRVRKTSPAGVITTVVGDGVIGDYHDGAPGTMSDIAPAALALGPAGELYILEYRGTVRKLTPDGTVTRIAGTGEDGFSGDGGQALNAQISAVAIAVDAFGNLYLAGNNRVRKITTDGIINTVLEATACGVVVDSHGALYVSDCLQNRIVKMLPGGSPFLFAGNGSAGTSGDSGLATGAAIGDPRTLALDSSGNVYVAQYGTGRIRRITPDGRITTVAGNGAYRFSGDGGPAIDASLNLAGYGVNIAVSDDGSVYFPDVANNRVRRISADGIISTVVGNGIPESSGDGARATAGGINAPAGVALDKNGNLYVSEFYGYRIRKVTPDGVITTYAGTGVWGWSGDGAPAVRASIDEAVGFGDQFCGRPFLRLLLPQLGSKSRLARHHRNGWGQRNQRLFGRRRSRHCGITVLAGRACSRRAWEYLRCRYAQRTSSKDLPERKYFNFGKQLLRC